MGKHLAGLLERACHTRSTNALAPYAMLPKSSFALLPAPSAKNMHIDRHSNTNGHGSDSDSDGDGDGGNNGSGSSSSSTGANKSNSNSSKNLDVDVDAYINVALDWDIQADGNPVSASFAETLPEMVTEQHALASCLPNRQSATFLRPWQQPGLYPIAQQQRNRFRQLPPV